MPYPETNLYTCQSILLAILFQNVLKIVKNQSACYIFTQRWGIISLILPSTSLIPVAEIWYRVACNRVTCFSHDRGNWRNSAHESKIYHVDYTICILNFIGVKKTANTSQKLKWGHVTSACKGSKCALYSFTVKCYLLFSMCDH